MKLIRYLLLGLLFITFAWGVYFVMSRQGQAISSNQAFTSEASHTNTPPSPPPPLYDIAALQQKLDAIVAAHPSLDSAVSIKAINDDETNAVQAEAEYIAASTTKAIVAVYALHQVEQGTIGLEEYIAGLTLNQQITKMIVDSNNTAWYALLEHFGYKNISRYANENGAPSFGAVENVITPADMSQFINNLHSGKLINAGHITYLEGLMNHSSTGPIKLNTEFASVIRKAGWLEDRAHLTGVITVGDKAVSYAIYTKAATGNSYSYSQGSALINEVLSSVTAALQ